MSRSAPCAGCSWWSRRPACRPPTGRSSRPSTAHTVGRCLAFSADDARVVDHLDQDHHRVRRLHDLVVVVVDRSAASAGRRSAEADQAALAERATLGTVESVPARAAWNASQSIRCVRHFAVRRLDDERGAVLALDLREPRAGVERERVVMPGSLLAVALTLGSVGLASAAENSANALVRSNSAASASLNVALPLNMSSRSSEVSEALVHVPCRSGVPHAVRGACHCESAADATPVAAKIAIATHSR